MIFHPDRGHIYFSVTPTRHKGKHNINISTNRLHRRLKSQVYILNFTRETENSNFYAVFLRKKN